MGITLFQASPFGLSPFANCHFLTRNVSPFHFCLGIHHYQYVFLIPSGRHMLWFVFNPPFFTYCDSLQISADPWKGLFFVCVFIMSESYFVVSLCPISFSSRLQPTILFPFMSWALWMLLQCMFVGWGCGQVFSMVCWFLKFSGIGTATWHHLSHFLSPRHFDSVAHECSDGLSTTSGI